MTENSELRSLSAVVIFSFSLKRRWSLSFSDKCFLWYCTGVMRFRGEYAYSSNGFAQSAP